MHAPLHHFFATDTIEGDGATQRRPRQDQRHCEGFGEVCSAWGWIHQTKRPGTMLSHAFPPKRKLVPLPPPPLPLAFSTVVCCSTAVLPRRVVHNCKEMAALLMNGANRLAFNRTLLNERASRSHSIFTIYLTKVRTLACVFTYAKRTQSYHIACVDDACPRGGDVGDILRCVKLGASLFDATSVDVCMRLWLLACFREKAKIVHA